MCVVIIAINGSDATCFETVGLDQCLMAAVTARDIVTADAAFAVTSLHDE